MTSMQAPMAVSLLHEHAIVMIEAQFGAEEFDKIRHYSLMIDQIPHRFPPGQERSFLAGDFFSLGIGFKF